MDPITVISQHPGLVAVAIAIGVVTEALGRAGKLVDFGRTKAWSLTLTFIPMLVGAVAGVAGAVPGETMAGRLAMGVATAWPVMVGWKVLHGTAEVLRDRAGEQ